MSYQSYQLVQLIELFGSSSQWIWENFDHVFIDELFDEKAKINEYLDEKDKDKETGTNKEQRNYLDRMRKDALIYNNHLVMLYSLYGETLNDYTKEELIEINNRQEKRNQKTKEAFDKLIEESKNKKDEDISKDKIITEESLKEQMDNKFFENCIAYSEPIEEDKKYFESLNNANSNSLQQSSES